MAIELRKDDSLVKSKFGFRQRLSQIIYIFVIVLLVWFLFKLGVVPWKYAMSNWSVLLLVMISTGLGSIIQAQAFRKVSIASTPPLLSITNIWSAASVVSVVAPLFAGIATRTALLMRSGMSLNACVLTSLRHIWMGMEYGLLLALISLFFTSWPFSSWAAIGSGVVWGVLFVIRVMGSGYTGQENTTVKNSKLSMAINSLRSTIPLTAHPWFILQVLTMSATYYLGFNGMGAELSLAQAMALSSLTVVVSLIVFVPNGLGITDVFWVLVASDAGLVLEQAVAIAIIMRLAHLLSSLSIYLVTRASVKLVGRM